jgi:hypothetical protein
LAGAFWALRARNAASSASLAHGAICWGDSMASSGGAVVVHAHGFAFGKVDKTLTACRFKLRARVVVRLEPKNLATAKVRHNRQSQAIQADAMPAKHALGHTDAQAGEQFTAVAGKLVR